MKASASTMRRALLGILIAALVAPLAATAEPSRLKVDRSDGELQLDLAALTRLAGEPRDLRVLEPHEAVERVYRGVPARTLLDAVFGEAWREAGAVLFECADGYRAMIGSDKLLAHDALLAWASGDDHAFTLVNTLQGGESVRLAPFYLVWDNIGVEPLLTDGANDWPYQVVGISLIDAREHLAGAWPPADAPPAVMRGFDSFRRHCVACHAVNGSGGHKGPDLNRPQSVTQRLSGEALRNWMLEPAAIRPGTTMPGLPATLADRAATAADIEAYLLGIAGRP